MVTIQVVEHNRSLRERLRGVEVPQKLKVRFSDVHYLKEEDVPDLFGWKTEDYVYMPDPDDRDRKTFVVESSSQVVDYVRRVEASELVFQNTKGLSLDELGPKLTAFMRTRDPQNLEIAGWEEARGKLG